MRKTTVAVSGLTLLASMSLGLVAACSSSGDAVGSGDNGSGASDASSATDGSASAQSSDGASSSKGALDAGAAMSDASLGNGFQLASIGCAMGHCTPLADDSDLQAAPTGGNRAWKDTTVPGANVQVGCSGNGTVAVCGLSGSSDGGSPSLVAYDATGAHVWTYAASAGFPAPMVDVNGGAIAANSNGAVRIAPDGGVMWTSASLGGAPKSPTPMGQSYVFLATSPTSLSSNQAPLTTVDTATGKRIHTYDAVSPSDSLVPNYYYSSGNSPAVSGSRAYVVMGRNKSDGSTDSCSIGRLFAFDVDENGAIKEAWRSAAFEAPSGASPMVVGSQIYFDGAQPAPAAGDGGVACTDDDGSPLVTAAMQCPADPNGTNPSGADGYFFDLEDDGTTSKFRWCTSIGAGAQANAPHDPRGGLWVYPFGKPALYHLDETTGVQLADSFLDLTTVVPGAVTVASDMTMSGSSAQPILILSVLHPLGNEVCALDLSATTNRTKWCVPSGVAAGQFPIIQGKNGPVVVYATAATGIEAIGN